LSTDTIVSDQLLCVAPHLVENIWPHVAHFIEAAFWTGLGDDNIATVKADLDAGNCLLWVVWDGTELIAAATTKIIAVPTKKICLITSCAGRKLERWKLFIRDLETYAADEGCDALRITGRPGWKAIFADYREPWVCIEKKLR
jgi:hypothetical protein